MPEPIRKAIVVGASSGIGAAIAKRLAADGAYVAVVARRDDELQRLCDEINQQAGEERAMPFVHDVRNRDELPLLFQDIARRLDGLDTIFYAAGVMPEVEPNEYSTDKDALMIEVNTIGAMAWLNEGAKRFERMGEGRLVGISSIAGDRGRRGNPAYCTSKAAMNTFLESLRNRLEVKGVSVTTIKPGFVDTVMTKGKPGLLWLISPEDAAKKIVSASLKNKNTAYVPGQWRLVGTIIRSIPSFLFKRINI
ncbi:MAG: SDR family NAD(P)-dependent oxidoreductase [Ignavibacteriae bacterium]|nr:SDR family NAD(P)-dependent oxidoreductase [Ignavibacteriota bacterium]MCB9217218.1 SDR family NAD(P)-dependent oxidoreductase [Ignavibacteria bacterium]